jgi:hypothetical protein
MENYDLSWTLWPAKTLHLVVDAKKQAFVFL